METQECKRTAPQTSESCASAASRGSTVAWLVPDRWKQESWNVMVSQKV